MESIQKKIKLVLKNLFNEKKSILIALSGGMDSMTLLDILLKIQNELQLKLNVAYVNHNLRNKESIKEEKLINKHVNKIGIPLHVLKVKKDIWVDLKQESIEMAARRIRYDFFSKIAKENHIDYIATAHNFNDKIETFFMQMFRGGGIDTLKSIPQKNKKIIRPMINITRKEIEEYAIKNNINYIEDSSNKDNIYKRNIIRNKLLPIFKEIHPNFEKSFKHVFKFINEEQELLNKLTQMSFEKILIYKSSNKICINKEAYLNLDIVIQKYLLKLILKKLGYPALPTLSLLTSLSGQKQNLSFEKKDLTVSDNDKYIIFINIKKLNILQDTILIDKIPFQYKKNGFLIKMFENIKTDPKKQFSFEFNPELFPLTIRKLQDEDYLYINETIKEKRIKKILKDMKIPVPLQLETLIIKTKKNEILGFYINNFFRVSKNFYIHQNNIKSISLTIKVY